MTFTMQGVVHRTLHSAVLLAGFAVSAGAITIDPDANFQGQTGNAAALELGALPIYDSVVRVMDNRTTCSGALISPTAVVTARHCTDVMNLDTLEVRFTAGDGTVKTSVAGASVTALTPDSQNTRNYFNGTDIAVVSLASPVSYDPYDILFSESDLETGELLSFAGYGRWGTGTTGATQPGDGQRRAAENTLGRVRTFTVDGNETMTLYADFDNGQDSDNRLGSNVPLAFEGLVGKGDSGGPVFFTRNNSLVLAGVLTGTVYSDGLGDGDFGDMAVWTAFSSEETRQLLLSAGANFGSPVPLPASAFFLFAGLGLLTIAPRVRKSLSRTTSA